VKPRRARKPAHQPTIRPEALLSYPPVSRRDKNKLLWPLLVSTLFLYLAISSASMDSATDDEPAHIVAGYVKLKHGHFDLYRNPLTGIRGNPSQCNIFLRRDEGE